MEPITLQEILEAVDGKLCGDVTDLSLTVEKVDTDSRVIHAGSMFLPLEGERFDGHAFINDALEAGAAGCLFARERTSYLPGKFYIKVNSTQRALRDLARWYKSRFDIPFIGVTGSVGKTTTKDMIAAVLGERYKVLKTEGNFNNMIGLPLSILRLNHSYEICVLEMGMDDVGQIDYLSGIVEPDVAVITNIGDAHIENLGSRENTLKAKSEIFNHLKKGGLAVLNGDDELLTTLRGQLAERTVWCGRSEDCDYCATDIVSDGETYIRCKVDTPNYHCDVEIPALGDHMVYPAMTAGAVGEHFGLTQEEIVRGILHFAPTKMRMNILRRDEGITILNDTYNANPQSMRAAIEVLATGKAKTKIAVLGDMLELGEFSRSLHTGVGEFMKDKGIDCLIAIGPECRYMAQGAERAGVPNVCSCEDKAAALEMLAAWVKPDTTFLVKASRGMRLEEISAYLLEQTKEG